MNLLHLDSSILGNNSASRKLSAAVVQQLKSVQPDVRVTYRDLAADPLPHLSGIYLAAVSGASPAAASSVADELAASAAVMDEFLAADVVVIGVAFYNFTVATQLKAWVDRILVAGKTFRYTQAGAEGLAGDKRIVLAIARGGYYGPGSPTESFEHAESYLRCVFGFIGIRDVTVVSADGIAVGPEQREKSLQAALLRITDLPALGPIQ